MRGMATRGVWGPRKMLNLGHSEMVSGAIQQRVWHPVGYSAMTGQSVITLCIHEFAPS